MKLVRIIVTLVAILHITISAFASWSGYNPTNPYVETYTTVTDTIPLLDEDEIILGEKYNPFDINPSNIVQDVEYDPTTNSYILTERIGEEYYRAPTYMTFEEYLEWSQEQQRKKYWSDLAGLSSESDKGYDLVDPMNRIDVQNSLVDRLFGGTEINIEPQGNVDISLGANYNNLTPQVNPNPNVWQVPDIDMKIRMNVDGTIGKKLKLGFNYDTQATFDFDRKIKLEFDSEQFSEDDIIKKIEAGNVSMPLRSNLIQGSQELFGLKTELQFGHLRITALASQQRSEQKDIKIENGASVVEFELTPDQYDENRHFFLSHYNRDVYEESLTYLPYISSAFKITRLEVWISEDRQDNREGKRMVVGITDLGEGKTEYLDNPNPIYPLNPTTSKHILPNGEILPDNEVSDLFAELRADSLVQQVNMASSLLKSKYDMVENRDFEIFQGRMLSPSEYSFNPQLGFISLNSRLRPNQRMGVVFEYQFNTKCDSVYTVGDFYGEEQSSTFDEQNQNSIRNEPEPNKVKFIKLLKSSIQNVSFPSWDLMMKNVYPLGTSQLNQESFEFDIFYDDRETGRLLKFIPENQNNINKIPLLQLFRLDNLNKFGDPQSDGIFDYVPGVTVVERSGAVIFPVLEPFGSSIDSLIKDQTIADQYRYQMLYDTSVIIARTDPSGQALNRFVMKGRVKSATSGVIQLGPFVPRGSVRVTAGGVTLRENEDYEIDYSLGRLTIINQAYLVQGTPLNVSFEDNATFSLQQKTMLGLRADYQLSKKASIGATFLRLKERPLTNKVNIGSDPINNKIFGLDFNYSDETPWVTNLVDKLPFYSTKAASNLSFSAEVAALVPGSNNAIDVDTDNGRQGTVYIDDFEGAVSGFLLGTYNNNQWTLASTPSDPKFPESQIDGLENGKNRALINWYTIDRASRQSGDNSDPYARFVNQRDLFQRETNIGQDELFTFDISYYPTERGPYNFDTTNVEINQITGELTLQNPQERWGGIMRSFQNTDFQAANYEFIEFWVLNPFMDRSDGEAPTETEQGELVFHLGNISEDILKDGNQFFENAMDDGEGVETTYLDTPWGQIPVNLPVTNVFNRETADVQDVGLDGLDNDGEREHYQESYLRSSKILNALDRDGRAISDDPSGDDFEAHTSAANREKASLQERYKKFNNPQGNFPDNANVEGIQDFVRGNQQPDMEDLNNNRSLDQSEAYFIYKIPIRKVPGTNKLDIDAPGARYRGMRELTNPNGTAPNDKEEWYRFQVPLSTFDDVFGDISDFRSIQFMRMYFTGFETAKTFRFAEMQLIRNQWRKAFRCMNDDPSGPEFTVDDVGVEENFTKTPFNYRKPPRIQEERIQGAFGNLLQDEKSLSLNVRDLDTTCEVSIFKLANLDLTFYENLQLIVHAEYPDGADKVEDGDLALFIKLGKDEVGNYYEYEMPLVMSNGKGAASEQDVIWPDSNFIDFPLEEFVNLKKKRIRDGLSLTERHSELKSRDGKIWEKYTIIGNPSIGDIQTIHIGIRNISETDNSLDAEVWVNEFRATGLKQKGGYAGQARLQMSLADLGEINAAASYNSIGWGGLDQRIQERSREEVLNYDIAGSLQLGKFFPEKAKLNIPIFAQYSKTISTPQFDPYHRDITVDDSKELEPEKADSIVDRSRETSTIKSINFTNVKTNVSTKKSLPWSPNNFSGTYAYTQTVNTDPIIKEDVITETQTQLEYNYSTKGATVQPFKFIKSKSLKFLSSFNFNLLPNRFGFNTQLNRYQSHRTFREPDSPVFRFDDQRYRWERNYTLDWNLAKSLRVNYKSNVTAIIDELRQVGIADDPDDRDWVNEVGDTVIVTNHDQVTTYRRDNLRDGGRRKNYTHNFNVNYKAPINLLPMMDWVTASADYKSDYGWKAGSLQPIDNTPGTDNLVLNTINNNQNISFNANLNFQKLYKKSTYLQAIEDGGKSLKRKRKRNKRKRSRISRTKRGNEEEDTKKEEKKEDEGEPRIPSTVERILIRPILMLRSAKLTYNERNATLIPGFRAEADLLGMSSGFGDPGVGFVLGQQPNLRDNSFLNNDRDRFNTSLAFNDISQQDKGHTVDLKIDLEPFKDFEIDLDWKKSHSTTETFVYRIKENPDDDFAKVSQYTIGSFDMTYLPLSTMFDDIQEVYQRFTYYRVDLSEQLYRNSSQYIPGDPIPQHEPIDQFGDYARGYGPTNYNVAVPAFLSAYTGMDRNTILDDHGNYQDQVSSKSFIPKPNWQVRYDGLGKLSIFKDILKSFSLKHGYKSNLRVNNFYQQINYQEDDNGVQLEDNFDLNGNYYSRFEIPAVQIDEQFSPLIGLSFKTHSDVVFDFEYRKNRNLDLRLQANELTERLGSEVIFGFGYIIKDFKGFGGGKKKRKRSRRKNKDGDQTDDKDDGLLGNGSQDNKKGRKSAFVKNLVFNLDFSLRDNITYKRDLSSAVPEANPTTGSRSITLNPTVDYEMNKYLTLRVYFNYTRNKNYVGSITTTNANGGVTARFILQ